MTNEKEAISSDGNPDNISKGKQMNNEIQPFEFEDNKVRALADGDEVMFVASDIAKILGYRDAANLARNLDDDERGIHEVSTPSGMQNMTVITESGLYRSILNRETAYVKEPEAQAFVKRFQRWVTHEVLPSIRKHGAYMTQQTLDKALTSPDFLIQLATKLKEEQEKVKELEPKARFADAVASSDGTCLVGELAKMLRQNGLDIGQNRLFENPPTGRLLGQDRLQPQRSDPESHGLGTVPHQGNRHHPFGRPRDHQPHREGNRQRSNIFRRPLLPENARREVLIWRF